MIPHGNFRQSALRLLTATLAITLLAAGPARGQLPRQDQIPANAVVAVGVADTGQFWSKAGNLPLTQAITQYLQSPQVTASLGFQKFMLERQKLEQTLGYPATPDELLKNVFSSALLTIIPAANPQEMPAMDLILGVKDKAKAAKLIEAVDSMNRQAADPAAAGAPAGQPAAPAPAGAVTFEKVTLFNTEVSHVTGAGPDGKPRDGYYALLGDRIVFSNNRGSMGLAIQNTKPAQAIAGDPMFAKLSGALPWDKAELAGFMDSTAILSFTKNPMLDMMRHMAPSESEKIAFTLQVAPDGVIGQVASSASPVPAGSALKPRQLSSMRFLSPAPMLAMVYGMLDAAQSYQQFNAFIGTLSMASAMSGQQGAMPAGNPLAELEQKLGISIQNDVIPAVGSEAMFSLNNLRIDFASGNPPTLDLVLGVEVRDQAKMKAVMDKLERYLEGQVAGMSGQFGAAGAAGAQVPKFATTPGPVPIRTLATGQPMISPSYALGKSYLLISINPASIQSALARSAGQQASAASAPAFTELRAIAGTDQIFSYSVVDVKQATQTILMPLASWMMLANPGKMSLAEQQQVTALVTQILPQIGTAASIETIKDGLSMGYFKLKM